MGAERVQEEAGLGQPQAWSWYPWAGDVWGGCSSSGGISKSLKPASGGCSQLWFWVFSSVVFWDGQGLWYPWLGREKKSLYLVSDGDCFSPRLKAFKAALLEVFKASHAQSVGLKSVMESINRDNPEPFSLPEVKLALAHMQDDNQIMVSDDIIFLI